MEFHEKYADKGLVLIAVTAVDNRQSAETIEQFVKDKGLPYAVAIDNGKQTLSSFKIAGFPSSYLVGTDGKVIREQHGPPGMAKAIEAALESVQVLPERELSSTFDEVAGFIKTRRWDGAVKRLVKLLASKKLDETDREAGEGLLADIDEIVGGQEMKRIAAIEAEQHYYRAKRLLEQLKKEWKGTQTAEAAAARLKEYKRDRDIKKLLKADELMTKAERLEQAGQWAKAARTWMKAAKTAKGTSLADQAEERARAAAEKAGRGR